MDKAMLAGLVISILLIVGLAIFTGMRRKKSGKIGWGVAAGLIMGTLVGGSSTVGTAQLAYNYGLSAWWFTLGGGIACLVLALVYVRPLRRQTSPTLVGMVRDEYGASVGMAATLLNSLGTFINILSQLLAASAVVLVVWPNMGTVPTIIIAAAFMVLYVVFGGTKGAGVVGILKLGLLYVSMVACGMIALGKAGGVGALADLVHGYNAETGRNFFSLFCRGFGTDFGACLSLILGVLTTQTYAQAVLNARSERDARIGALVSAFLIPPIGACGIVVGLFMRSVTDPSTFVAKTALTQFVLDYMPSLLGGIVLGTLFIASVGTGAGLALGISTVINRDLIQKYTNKFAEGAKNNLLGKLLIVIVLALATLLACTPIGDTILKFAFLSMGLRGCTVFAPLCFLIWAKGKVNGKFAMVSVVGGSLVALLFGVLDLFNVYSLPVDAVFPGVIVGVLVMVIGYICCNKKGNTRIA